MGRVLLLLFLLSIITVNSQDNLWKEVSKSHLKSKDKKVRPSKYKVYRLDLQLLKEELEKAPEQRENINRSTVILSFPDENGVLKEYKIAEASVMNVELQENHPTIKSYIGKSVDNSNSIIRFSISPYVGFNGIVLNISAPPTLIAREGNYYQVFSEKDFPTKETPFECGVIDQVESKNKKSPLKKKTLINGQLRTYRMALVTTGEYSQYILNDLSISSTASDEEKKTAILGHLNSIMTNVNVVFERDVAVTMELVTNNKDIIFLDGSTDNLDNSATIKSYNKNKIVCDNIIGNSNYDIGHLLSKIIRPEGASGVTKGIAFPKAVCNSRKAAGVSGFSEEPNHPSKYYRILIHELGHQFGAKHTYNIPPLEIRNNESVEVERGFTIMSYGGVGIDLFFHSVSIAKMRDFIQNSANCASTTSTGNTPPIANAGSDYTIPKSTPFLLEAASDPDNSTLTYTWEQVNSEEGIFPLVPYASKGPVFRWLPPIAEPKRYMPNINTILNGETKNTFEAVPSVSRSLYFMFFVRDNHIEGGETDADAMLVTIDNNSGPFIVTSNNSPETWYSGTTRTVSWDVANTNSGLVNAPTVDILFSTDGGITYPTTLASNVANNGSYSFEVPFGISTTKGRFMIKANGNIFLDVNNADITVEEKEFLVDISDEEKEKSLCLTSSSSISYDFTYNSYLGFNETVGFSASGLNGATITFLPASTNTDGANITITISNINTTNIGANTIPIIATTSSSFSFTNQVTLNVYDSSPLNAVSLTSPSNGTPNFLEPFTFQWNAENDADSYIIQISTDNGFSNIVDNATVTSNSFVSTSLNYNATYYWRVKAINACVDGLLSNVFSFTTPLSAHANDTYIPDDIFEQVLIDLGYDTGTLDDYVPTRNINTVTELNLSSLNIGNLTGIEAFTALDSLNCSDNPLSVLDVSSNTALTYLYCPSVTVLDVSKNTHLTALYFSGSLSKLDLSKNTALTDLRFSFTELTSLDLSKNTKLTTLSVRFNYSLASLNLRNGKNTILTDFFFARNSVLRCIQVDNATWSTDNWTKKDGHSLFSENCANLGYNNFKMASFSISPNPVTNILSIESTNNIKVEQVKIFSILGELIYDKRNKNNQIDFSNFSKAIYILKLIDKEGRYTIKKVLKE